MKYLKASIQIILTFIITTLLILPVYAEETPPIGQSKGRVITKSEGINADIFGQKGGRFHPFLIFQEVYTDNLFATHNNTKDDFITTIAPGIWLAFPANR